MKNSFEHFYTCPWDVFGKPVDFPIRVLKLENILTTTDLHNHEFLEIFLVLGGEGKYLAENGEQQLSMGDMFFMSPSQIHGFQEQKNLSIYNILIQDMMSLLNLTPECSTSVLQLFFSQTNLSADASTAPMHIHLKPSQFEAVVKILDAMHAESLTLGQNFQTMLRLLFGQLFVTLERCVRVNKAPFSHYPSPILKVLTHIHQNYSNDLSSARLAALANMTEKTFYRHFKQTVGMTAYDYISKLRLERASIMLANTDAPISEIAFRCGYVSSIYFSQVFKRRYAMTPGAYRKNQPCL